MPVSMTAISQIALADFRERVRRFNFLVVIALAVFLGYQVISGFFLIRLGEYRAIINAAWVGTLMSLTLSVFLSLFGFYVVRGNVQQDRRTGVGQVLAATPMGKFTYVAGKFFSNSAVLLVVIFVLMMAALAMLAIHGEDKALDLYQLIMPFLAFTLPVALVVAALAVFFECTPFLCQSAGNITYFFLWLVTLGNLGGSLLAFNAVERAMITTINAQGGSYQGGIAIVVTELEETSPFLFSGFDWVADLAPRLVIMGCALLIVLLASLPFDRFDSSGKLGGRVRAVRQSVRKQIDKHQSSVIGQPDEMHDESGAKTAVTADQLSTVNLAGSSLQVLAVMVLAEFKLMLKGRPVLWYCAVGGLVIATLTAPLPIVRQWLLPGLWLLPITIWSELGVREIHSQVNQVLFSAPSPLRFQLAAAWFAGVLSAIVLGLGVLLRFLSEPGLIVGFFAGAVFFPSLALMLGVATKTDRAFQIVLLIIWYLGPLNGLTALDVTAAADASLGAGIPWLYIAISPFLLGLTLVIRWHQLQSG